MMLTLSCSNIDQWTILHVVGEVDMATGPQLRQEIVREVSQGSSHIVVDLQNVDFIDSTGLGILVGGVKRARSNYQHSTINYKIFTFYNTSHKKIKIKAIN